MTRYRLYCPGAHGVVGRPHTQLAFAERAAREHLEAGCGSVQVIGWNGDRNEYVPRLEVRA